MRWIEEERYEEQMETLVEPYLAARRETGFDERVKGEPIYYEHYRADSPKGVIVISHGLSYRACAMSCTLTGRTSCRSIGKRSSPFTRSETNMLSPGRTSDSKPPESEQLSGGLLSGRVVLADKLLHDSFFSLLFHRGFGKLFLRHNFINLCITQPESVHFTFGKNACSFSHTFWVCRSCVAAIGVCVFRARLRLRTFLLA